MVSSPICHSGRIGTTRGLLHATRTVSQAETATGRDRQYRLPLSDRVDTAQRPVHYQQQTANCCTLWKVPFLCCGWDGRRTVFLASCRYCWGRSEVSTLHNPLQQLRLLQLLQFDVLTTLSLRILHSFSCCSVRNLWNPAKFTKNSNLWSSGSSKVIDLGVIGKPICDSY